MWGRLLFILFFLSMTAPAAQSGEVDRTSYCQTVEPADWADTSGRWAIPNDTDSPLTLMYRGHTVSVVVPGPETGVENKLRAYVRTDRLRDGSYERTWMSYLPAGETCYGVFDAEQFVSASHNGTRIPIQVRRLHRLNRYEVVEHQTYVEDPSDMQLTDDTYVLDYAPIPGTSQYTWAVTGPRVSRSQH